MVSGSGLRPRSKPQSGSQAPDKPKGTKTVKKTHTLRDQWFAAALKGLKPLFADIGYPLTAEVIRISAGFPSKGARSLKSRRIGECWDATAIADGVCQIYISPVLVDPVKVLGVLVHELVHAAVGCKCGHTHRRGAGFNPARRLEQGGAFLPDVVGCRKHGYDNDSPGRKKYVP